MNWVREMTDLKAGIALVAPERTLEVRYERLLAHPISELDRVAEFLGLEGFSSSAARTVLERLDLRPRPEGWRTRPSADVKARVQQIQGSMLATLGNLPEIGASPGAESPGTD